MSIYRDWAIRAVGSELFLVLSEEPGLCFYCCEETYWIEPFTGIRACCLEHLVASMVPGRWGSAAGEPEESPVH